MKPLEGITVLEFSTMITASFATMMMAEQGARVIKVEPIEAGDPMRYFGTSKAGIASLFANCNRGKRAIRINIKEEAGQAVIRDMISAVDVLIHNYRPGVMDRLNLGSDSLREINPQLVYAAISGFGKEGPLSDAPAYDPIIQAHTGMTATQGTDELPAFFRSLICDKITAYTACQAVTAALYSRERLGEGQHIDLSMLDSGLFFIFPDGFQNHTLLDDDVAQEPLMVDMAYELTMTKDGVITISAGTRDMKMRSLAAVGVQPTDEGFDSLENLVASNVDFKSVINKACLGYTTNDVIQRLKDADVPCARCLSRDEVLAQEQVIANDLVEVVDHPIVGRMRIVKSPSRFGGERLPVSRPSPDHGEHTREVLEEFQITADRLQELVQTGVIGE